MDKLFPVHWCSIGFVYIHTKRPLVIRHYISVRVCGYDADTMKDWTALRIFYIL